MSKGVSRSFISAPVLALCAPAAIVLATALADAARAQPAAAPDPCAAGHGPAVAIEAVTDAGDIRLSDGRLGRLADLDLGRDAISAGAWPGHVAAIRKALVGLTVTADEDGGFPDRWGRRPFRLSLAGDSETAHRLLAARGLARIAPLGEQEACAISLLPLEAAARAQKAGLWREPAARALGAGEAPAIRAMAGRFALVEGKVVSVGERPRRIYLNFGRDFQRDFVATLSPKTARHLEKAGISPSSLRGKTVRVRGVIVLRRAPAIEITGPVQIEVVR